MEFTSYRCDECGRVKGEANHWFRISVLPGPRFVIIPWNLSMLHQPAQEKHICGLGCATKALVKAMTESQVEEEGEG